MQKVLIVEDDESFRKQIIREIYKNELDVEITEAKIESEALSITKYLNFDICLIDVEFPNISKFGIELARKLKEKNPEQQIMMMSEYSDESTRDKVHNELDISYFYKKDYCEYNQNYDFTQLIEKLKRALAIAKKLNKRELSIKKRKYFCAFDIDDVWYVEKVYGTKHIEIHAYDQRLKKVIRNEFKNMNLKEIPEMLDHETDLIQINRSCMINPSKKRLIDFVKKKIILKGIEVEFYFEENYREAVEMLR